jgi:hypothetical protein
MPWSPIIANLAEAKFFVSSSEDGQARGAHLPATLESGQSRVRRWRDVVRFACGACQTVRFHPLLIEPDMRIAPSTYHERVAQRQDPTRLSARARQDAALKPEIARVFAENFAVYGVRKVWRQMIREGSRATIPAASMESVWRSCRATSAKSPGVRPVASRSAAGALFWKKRSNAAAALVGPRGRRSSLNTKRRSAAGSRRCAWLGSRPLAGFPVLAPKPPTQPHHCVAVGRPVRLARGSNREVVGP